VTIRRDLLQRTDFLSQLQLEQPQVADLRQCLETLDRTADVAVKRLRAA
jgi:hypothetical protein